MSGFLLNGRNMLWGNARGTEGLPDVGQRFLGFQGYFADNEILADGIAVQLIARAKAEDILCPFWQGYLAFTAEGRDAVHGAMIA